MVALDVFPTIEKFIKAIPKWDEWIEVSFLPDEMKGKYNALIAERIGQLR